MLERFRKARQTSQEAKGQSRTDEQTPSQDSTSEATPEVQPTNDAVLAYLVACKKAVTLSELARGSGVTRYKASKRIEELLSEGTVVSVSEEGKSGQKYQIIGGGPNPSKVTETPFDGISEEDSADFVKITNELVFSFIRATRSTDVLLYLTWLERQGKEQ